MVHAFAYTTVVGTPMRPGGGTASSRYIVSVTPSDGREPMTFLQPLLPERQPESLVSET